MSKSKTPIAKMSVDQLMELMECFRWGQPLERSNNGGKTWEVALQSANYQDMQDSYPFNLAEYTYREGEVDTIRVNGKTALITDNDRDEHDFPAENIRQLVERWAVRRTAKGMPCSMKDSIVSSNLGATTVDDDEDPEYYVGGNCEKLEIGCQTFTWSQVSKSAIKLGWLTKTGKPTRKVKA